MEVVGLVDSGADRTLLPMPLAPELGIDPALDLEPQPGGSAGAGGLSFPTWTARKTIQAQVLGVLRDHIHPFGPVFALAPVFADDGPALWGRRDFFAAFTITFESHTKHGPVFHLDC